MTLDELQTKIIDDLTEELSKRTLFDADLLEAKVESAIEDVKRRRNYRTSGYSESEIADDMEQFYSNIRNVALYDYDKIGAFGETSHNEGGTNRSWRDREAYFIGVAPFVG